MDVRTWVSWPRPWRVIGAVACLVITARCAVADEVTLADLLSDPEASITSDSGRVVFSDFAFETPLGAAAAPEPDSVRVIADREVPDGFRIEGAFQTLNGVRLIASLDFTATSILGDPFDRALLGLGSPTAFGSGGPKLLLGEGESLVRVNEAVFPVLGEDERRLEVFLDANGVGLRTATVGLDPEVFGASLRVSQDIILSSAQSESGSVAILSAYTTSFSVVPEPATLLLLLGAAPMAWWTTRTKKRGRESFSA